MTRLTHIVGVLLAVVVLLAILYAAIPVREAVDASGEGYVDMHAHVAGIGAGDSGAFINQEMRESLRFPFYLRAFGVTEREVLAQGDALVAAKISAHVAASKRVRKAVLLAMDGVIDRDGALDREKTQIYVPNEFVLGQAKRYDNLCFGASVNPYRPDAIERLRWAAANGALLLKWLPNIMHIDPADDALRPFYRELVALDLPLLTHTGQERSFGSAVDEFGDPRRLELPLTLGVTVIAAHIATTGENQGEDNFARILPMFERYPNLYADISSLTQVNKLGYLRRALAVPDLAPRLLYGTDWPLQFFPLVSPYFHVNHIGLVAAKSVAAIDNPWDRDVALKEALGVPEAVFRRSGELLAMERCL